MHKFLCVLILTVAVAAQDDGQYRPELYNQGGNDGRYYPSDDGKYVHVDGGNDGRYYPSDDGKYVHIDDGDRGQYNGDNGKYVHQGDNGGQYVHQADNSGQYKHVGDNGDSGRYTGDNGQYVHTGDGDRGQYNGNNQNGGNNFGNKPSATNQGAGAATRPGNGNRPGNRPGSGSGAGSGAGSGSGSGASRPNSGRNQQPSSPSGKYQGGYRIIKHVKTQDEDGYHYMYETENKIFGEEQGKVHNKGTDDEALKAFGYYKYTGLDNVEYRVDYTADENGFVPQGAHLHPVPESVKRTLEYLKQKGLL